MVTLAEFGTTLARSIVDMVRIIGADVALADPLSTISVLMGALVMAVSVGIFGGLVLGAVGDLLGVTSTR